MPRNAVQSQTMSMACMLSAGSVQEGPDTQFLEWARRMDLPVDVSWQALQQAINITGKAHIEIPQTNGRWLRWLAFVCKATDKDPGYIVWEASEEVAQQQRLQRERDSFEALVDLSSEGFSIFDRKGVIIYDSKTNVRLTGYEASYMTGRSFLEFIHPEDLPGVMEQFSRLVEQPGAVDQAVVRWRHADGHWVHFEGSVINLLHEPRIRGLINNFRDVGSRLQIEHDLRQAKEKAEQAQLAQQRFLTNLTHELRTPFTLIQQPLAELRKLMPMELLNHPHWGIVERNIARLDGLLGELIDLSRLELAQHSVSFSAVCPQALLEGWVAEFAELAKAKNLHWCWELEEVDTVFIDVEKTTRIVFNLLSNAIKFSPAGGTIAVRLGRESDGMHEKVFIEVEDAGPGVPEAERERIFERFYQVSVHGVEAHEGMGIGLALVREFTQIQGGEVSCLEGVLGGARMRVTLPAGADHIHPGEIDLRRLAQPLPSRTLPPTLQPPMVEESPLDRRENLPLLLLAEDNPDMRCFLCTHLKAHFRVEEVDNGVAALNRLERSPLPAIALLDVMMPEKNGLEVCRELRNHYPDTILPVLLLSAKGSGDDRAAGLAAGANDYLGKPFVMGELIARLQMLVGGRQRSPTPSSHPAIRRLKEVIAQGLAEPGFSIRSVAKKTGLSIRQLQRLTNEELDLSPGGLVHQMRVDKAKSLLMAEQKWTVSEISAAVGLSPHYFNRLFRSMTGFTPLEYRTQGHLASNDS